MTKLQIQSTLVLCALLLSAVNYSHEAIFSSILRNNLNRYLKNPLFTKSFVRNTGWPGEPDEFGSSALITPQNAQINEFIQNQNKFTSSHVLEPYANYNFDVFSSISSNDIPGLMPAQNSLMPQASSNQPSSTQPKRSNSKFKNPNQNAADSVAKLSTNISNTYGARTNSKSLIVNASNKNSYSDTKKMKSYITKNSNIYSPVKANKSNSYTDDNIDNSVTLNNSADIHRMNRGSDSNSLETINKLHNFETNLKNGNLYNQEKALNLKMEYGFKPLPTTSKTSSQTGANGQKDYTGGNSIQFDDPFDFMKSDDSAIDDARHHDINNDDEDDDDDHEDDKPGNNIYSFSNNNRGSDNSLNLKDNNNPIQNRSMKSMQEMEPNQQHLNNHMDEFSVDYKKYISYPMETESSDIHKLAFTSMESFKPDHNYMDSSIGRINHRLTDTIFDYPNIKNFKTQGVDCARGAGYCDYDSSYPKDYVNSVVTNCSSIIDDMYIEMPENLADYSGYKSFIQVGKMNIRRDSNLSLCDADRKYIRPSVAQDINGNFHLILQSSFYFQQIPVEICTQPGSTCNVVGHCNSQVKCTQKYRTHMLISLDEDNDSPHHNHHQQHSSQKVARNCPKMRMYRLPSSCVCELQTN